MSPANERAPSGVGKVWLVGAGPGDPGLITVRGLAVLQQADVVLYDALSHPALLDACPQAELRDVGKRGGRFSPGQRWITEQLATLARAGKRVVRLKGGDSYLFARGAEEAQQLAAEGIPFEVVPGLSSPVGTSAYAGIPLTHRDLSSSVTFITGSDKAGAQWSDVAWKKLATATDTLCILMGMRNLEQIAQALQDGGRPSDTPVAIVQWGARPAQRVAVATLATIAAAAEREGLKNPAVIIVGEVVALRETLNWFESKPLFGKRILIPRPPHQAVETSVAVRERGAEPVLLPLIYIEPPPEPARLTEAILQLENYDWVLFTSSNGVDCFFRELHGNGLDARALGKCRVGAIGPRTSAALGPFGLRADLVAEEYIGESLAKSVLQSGPAKRVLIPRALVAREELPESLRRAGLEVDVVPAYQTCGADSAKGQEIAQLIRAGGVDVVLFTSSSTVQHAVRALGSEAQAAFAKICVASIGPITSKTLMAHGIAPDVSAQIYTVAGLLDALDDHWKKA